MQKKKKSKVKLKSASIVSMSSHPVTVPHYGEEFSMITNTWNDVLGPKGETLKIGANFLPIRGKTCKQFINTCNDAAYPSPLEVKTALSLLLQLTLENHKNADKVTDSLMLRICESSKIDESRNNLGSTCKYGTKAFIEAYINYLTFNITFNNNNIRS